MDVDLHVKEVAEQGYTVVENAIEPALVDELNDSLSRLERFLEVQPSPNSFEGHKTLRIYNLLAYDDLWQRVPVHDHVLPVVERVLDPGCLISSLSSIDILPGESAQPIHADDQLIPLPKPHPPTVCNSMWALTDFTEANGATRLVSRHAPLRPQPRLRRRVRLDRGRDAQGLGAHLAREPVARRRREHHERSRVGIAMNYCAGYIRQQENQQLGLPREKVQTFEPRLRELVGYGVYNMLIGHINKQSPEQLLLGDGSSKIVWDGI